MLTAAKMAATHADRGQDGPATNDLDSAASGL